MSINFLTNVSISQGAGLTVAVKSDQLGLQQVNLPAFAAHSANAMSGGQIVTWTAVEFDTKNNFVPGTGRFTASIAGYYYFKYHQLVSYDTAGDFRANIRVNGTGQWGRSIYTKAAQSSFSTIFVDAKIFLQVGDYADVYIEAAPTPLRGDAGWSFFQGYKL